MADLRSCPFCGGEVKGYLDNHKKAMIECEKCNMYFGVKLEIGCELVEGWKATFDTKEELFEAWNTRKPMEAVVAELENAMKTALDEVKLPIPIFVSKRSLQEFVDICFGEAILIVRGKE